MLIRSVNSFMDTRQTVTLFLNILLIFSLRLDLKNLLYYNNKVRIYFVTRKKNAYVQTIVGVCAGV